MQCISLLCVTQWLCSPAGRSGQLSALLVAMYSCWSHNYEESNPSSSALSAWGLDTVTTHCTAIWGRREKGARGGKMIIFHGAVFGILKFYPFTVVVFSRPERKKYITKVQRLRDLWAACFFLLTWFLLLKTRPALSGGVLNVAGGLCLIPNQISSM